MKKLPIKLLRIGAQAPCYMTPGAVGADVFASIPGQGTTIGPHTVALIPLGFATELPEGAEIQMRGRSGLALKGIMCFSGTVDSDYRGELMALLYNTTDRPYNVRPGDRVAQLVLSKTERVTWVAVADLSPTSRAEKGFGSTDERKT